MARVTIVSGTLQYVASELRRRKIGRATGLVLPKPALRHMGLGEGDTVLVTMAAHGSPHLSAGNAPVTRQLKAAQKVIRRYRPALRDLAK